MFLRSRVLVVTILQICHKSPGHSFLATNGETRSSSGLLFSETGSNFVSFGNSRGLFEAVEFNMAIAGQVWGNTTMGSVGSSTSVDGSLADGVVDVASIDVESFGFSVGA